MIALSYPNATFSIIIHIAKELEGWEKAKRIQLELMGL